VGKVILQNAITEGRYPTGLTRLGAYLLFNRVAERWVWSGFRAFGRIAPRAALKRMLGSLSSLPPERVLAAMSQDRQDAALAFLLACRSGSGFLHDIHHRCGDLGRITAPTFIIESKYDGSKDPSHATYAAAHIADAELFLSPAESHLLWFSVHDDAIREKMRAFLQSWCRSAIHYLGSIGLPV